MGFFQTFWTWLNTQVTGYIADSTARVATAIEPAVVALAVVYVMTWGYLQLTGRTEEPLTIGLTRIVRLVAVLGTSLHLWLYNDLIVDTFYHAPAQLASAVAGASDPVTTIDAIWNRGGAVGDILHQRGSLWPSGFGFLVAAWIVWLLVGLLCIYVMFLIALSSIASAVLLAIGPLFVALWLFDSTRRLFEAWVAQLVNYALITILTVLVAALLLHIMQSYATQTAALGSALTTVDALNMLLMAGLVFLLLRQILPIAAGLAGSVALSSLNSVSRSLLSTARQPIAVARLGMARQRVLQDRRRVMPVVVVGTRGTKVTVPNAAPAGRDG
jgi:type IV secretion system protein VirB6